MTYFDSKVKKDCNGCGVCSLKCPQHAIKMEIDSEGFAYPVIDSDKCVNCGLCKKICPNHEYEENVDRQAYIAINNDKSDLKRSASGGMFYPLAKYVIENDGVVFGAKFDSDLNVVHDYATDLSGAKKFQGSKYVRSDLNGSFEKVKEFLESGKLVLFTGTPCQCAGLRAFIGKENDNLITCEIICHSNPSPKIYKMYKSGLELKYKKSVKAILFRTKEMGWVCKGSMIKFDDGSQIVESTFHRAFLSSLISRPSCNNCYFCTDNRLSDFTIGDAWGVDKLDPTIKNDNTGISLLCVNSDKGKKILEFVKDEMFLKEVDIKTAFTYNHNHNTPINKNREKLFKGIVDGSITEKNILESLLKYSKKPLWRRALGKAKRIVKNMVKK